MIATGLFAVALFAQQTSTPPNPPSAGQSAGDGLAAQIIAQQPPETDFAALHAEVSDSPRDLAWSRQAEAALLQRYRDIPGFDAAVQSLSITCAMTLCEVAGLTRSDLPSDDLGDLMIRVQTPGHPDSHPELDRIVSNFSSTVDQPQAMTFLSYWRRRE